ncbi:MAG: hydantoinase/oxoprolinase family protein [Gemmatimonadaceae bacterium]
MTDLSVGVDVGGTFTDLVAIGADATVSARKVSSTPGDQSEGVMAALDALGRAGHELARIVHGTTVATNTLLERSGARVVLCATEGATDLLELRRQERAELYDLSRHHPLPLVPRDRVIPVPERAAPEGVSRALSESAAREVAVCVRSAAPECVAVSLLHAYAYPDHERLLAAALREAMPGTDVVLSSNVLPEIREYERTATTVAEAYLRPRVARYVSHLAARLAERGFPAPAVMTSAGGMRSAAESVGAAASLALSGPAGGVVGAAAVAHIAGFADALTIDIGGTSADVGLILEGAPLMERGGAVAGVPIALPRVLVETVSAGGGSVGWVDDGGALRVGPRSAGALPGPAAFGRGGQEATVTDAHIVLGSLRPERVSGGIALSGDAARAAVGRLASRLGVSPERAAMAMVAAADAAMARALRRVSVERGVDPRRCVLVAFGGGGPLHACGLADQLGLRAILVPPLAGVLSALGLAMAAERREAIASVMRGASELDGAAVGALAHGLAERAGPGQTREWWARVRYRGQGHEVEVPFAPGDDGGTVAARFATLHEDRFGFTLDTPVEVVSARHAALGRARELRLARVGQSAWSAERMADSGAALDVAVRGRAVISLPDSTLLVTDDWRARALPMGGWLLERAA